MIFIALATALELLFFYGLGRLHREDNVDPRMRHLMLLIGGAALLGMLVLSPLFFVWLKAALRVPQLSIQAAPYGVNISYSAKWSPGTQGQPDIVYASPGEQLAILVIAAAVSLSPYAGYVAGRTGIPRLPSALRRLEARIDAASEIYVDPGRIALLEAEVEELRRRLEELAAGDGYHELDALAALIVGD